MCGELKKLTWSVFFQRLLVLGVVGALILVLIGDGVDASLALNIAGTVVLITKDFWVAADRAGPEKPAEEEAQR